MKRSRRLLALGLSLVMGLMLLEGCAKSASSGTDSSSSSASTTESSSTASSKKPSDYKIALIINGSAKDGGWCQQGVDALSAIEKEYGCKTDYSENVAATDYEMTISGYADAGYDIIIAHGSQFLDACKAVAGNYPDTLFICNSALEGQAPNVAGVQYAGYDGGYFVGAALGLVTKTNKIGVVVASEEGANAEWINGVRDGAASVNKDSNMVTINTDSWDDASKAKQAVDSLASQGVDAISENCNSAEIGAVEESSALGIFNVGWNMDCAQYGDTAFISVLCDTGYGLQVAIKEAMEGKLNGRNEAYKIGAPEGIFKFTDYTGKFANALTDEQKDTLKGILQKACDGAELK